MNGYDAAARDIFQSCDNDFHKLLALLGDSLRESIHYPMRTDTTSASDFLSALYADYAVYNARRFVPEQPDRGSFDSRDLSAVEAKDDEAVLFSWIEWPDKATRDAGMKKVMDDPRMDPSNPMPFDGKRMIFGGFSPVLDIGG